MIIHQYLLFFSSLFDLPCPWVVICAVNFCRCFLHKQFWRRRYIEPIIFQGWQHRSKPPECFLHFFYWSTAEGTKIRGAVSKELGEYCESLCESWGFVNHACGCECWWAWWGYIEQLRDPAKQLLTMPRCPCIDRWKEKSFMLKSTKLSQKDILEAFLQVEVRGSTGHIYIMLVLLPSLHSSGCWFFQ